MSLSFSPSSLPLHLLMSVPSYLDTFCLVLALSFHVMLVKTSMVSIVVLYLWLSTLDWSQKQKNTQPTASEPIQQSWSLTVLCLVCSRSSPLTLYFCTLSSWLEICYLTQSSQDLKKHQVLGQFLTYDIRFTSVTIIVWRETKWTRYILHTFFIRWLL